LYRQAEIYEREGVELERSTLAGWVGGASRVLAPLVEATPRHILKGAKLHGDDIPVPVLAPGNAKTKTGPLWTDVCDDRPARDTTTPAVWFAYSPDRKGEHPRQHLRGFTGTLQADGYAGFQRLYGVGRSTRPPVEHMSRVSLSIDHAHARPIASEALSRIGQMYGMEARFADVRRMNECKFEEKGRVL
jgi:hypothetical protein